LIKCQSTTHIIIVFSIIRLNLDGVFIAVYGSITYQESRACLKVIELCNEQNIILLPIHDSFKAKKQHRDTLEVMMVQAYELLGFQSVPMVTEN
jgi:hypothetical protein